MDGIVFFRTRQHDEVVDFYRELGATVWREQPDCTILQAGDFRVGFCAREAADTEGIVTFVFEDRAGVDAAYDDLADRADEPPRFNERYGIYQFFATDPEGRTVEFQTFE
ncbi:MULTISPECIES: VOC family protein [Salinibaculum]|uniref:VOC family protein n=1 Tax=Salinibaculum TaxID=2732368 RepID=UPI0030D35A69